MSFLQISIGPILMLVSPGRCGALHSGHSWSSRWLIRATRRRSAPESGRWWTTSVTPRARARRRGTAWAGGSCQSGSPSGDSLPHCYTTARGLLARPPHEHATLAVAGVSRSTWARRVGRQGDRAQPERVGQPCCCGWQPVRRSPGPVPSARWPPAPPAPVRGGRGRAAWCPDCTSGCTPPEGRPRG